MHVLLTTYGSRGDVEPVVALAVELRNRGARVTVCAPPDTEYAQRLAGAGVLLMPVGGPVRPLMHGATPLSAEELGRRRLELVAEQFDRLSEAAEGCDVLVATGLMQVAARSVAEGLGIPYVYASYQPTALPSPHHAPPVRAGLPVSGEVTDNRVLWERDARAVTELFGEALNTGRASIGLPPVDNVRDHIFTARPWLAADPVLGPWQETAGIDVVQTGAWTLRDERPLPGELSAFLEAGAPPVYVGFGSMPAPQDAARVAVEAVRAQGHRTLLARGWADLTQTDVPQDCFVVTEVNLQRLLPRVAAAVHHGGAGTTATAARAGVPQVIVPQMVDQPYWADRVAALGIGVAHDGATPTPESLSAALKSALADEVRARADAVAARLRGDGASTAAGLVLDLAAGRRPAAPE